MSNFANLHSVLPTASQVASSNGSDGSSTWILLVLIAIAAIWLLAALGGSEPTVVVVQKSSGSFLGWAVIAIAVVILFLVYVAPGSSPI
jgi:hypothetical protein